MSTSKLTNLQKSQKTTTSYKYESNNTKSYNSNSTTKKSSTSKNQVLSPAGHTAVGVTNKIDKGLKYNLNMNWGEGDYGNTAEYFDRLYSVYLESEIDSIRQYIFIVRPDLNIIDKNGNVIKTATGGIHQSSSPSNDQFFLYMNKKYPHMLRNLSSTGYSGHAFIPFLVGRSESLQFPDYTLKDYSIEQPYSGYKQPYASHANDSKTGGNFEISFRDDKEYRIHKMFQAWTYYIDGVTTNKFAPKTKYIVNNEMDYATSVYCITCKADGESIIYWAKYTGAYPTNSPNSDLSFNLRGEAPNKCSIPFSYFKQEVLDPLILVDFNINAGVKSPRNQRYIPMYRADSFNKIGLTGKKDSNGVSTIKFNKSTPVTLGSGNGLVGCPFICRDSGNNYYLRWKKIKDLTPS